jgi:hypothetical protein
VTSKAKGLCDPLVGGLGGLYDRLSILFVLIIYLLVFLHMLSSVILHLSSPHSISIYPHISFLYLLLAASATIFCVTQNCVTQ